MSVKNFVKIIFSSIKNIFYRLNEYFVYVCDNENKIIQYFTGMRLFTVIFCLFALSASAQQNLPSDRFDFAENTEVADNRNENHEKIDVPLGVDLMAGDVKGLTLFPNPANDHLLVSLANSGNDLRHISIVNTMGQQVFKMKNRREGTFLVDVSGLRNGIYSVEVISGSHVYRKKWVKR
jgi:hypothetical protein